MSDNIGFYEKAVLYKGDAAWALVDELERLGYDSKKSRAYPDATIYSDGGKRIAEYYQKAGRASILMDEGLVRKLGFGYLRGTGLGGRTIGAASKLKNDLFKLGSTNPELRPHIREILKSRKILAFTKDDIKEIEGVLKSVGATLGKPLSMKALMDASTSNLSRAESVIEKYLNTYSSSRERYKGVDLVFALENFHEIFSEEISDRSGKAHSIRNLIRALVKAGVKVTRTLENSFHDKSDAAKALKGASSKSLGAIFDAAQKTVQYYQGKGKLVSGSDMYLRSAKAYLDASEALKPAPVVTINDLDLEDLWESHTRLRLDSVDREGNKIVFVARTGINYADTESDRDYERGVKMVSAVGNAIVKSTPSLKGSKVTADWVEDDYFSVTLQLIKLSSAIPEIRPHIRPVVSSEMREVTERDMQKFVANVQDMVDAYYAKMGYTTQGANIKYDKGGMKYYRVYREDTYKDADGNILNVGSKSAFCFVDRATGDVFKPASWKAPAKHARGTIFGRTPREWGVNPLGANYLR